MKTQKQIIIERIQKTGSVDNLWAMNNYILRLASRISELRDEGYNLVGKFGKELNKPRRLWKNYYYILKK